MTYEPNFTADHKTNICSSGKSVAAVVFGAALVDKGLLKYDEKVTTYWPEFEQNGKENMKIEDIMRHDAGLAKFPTKFSISDVQTENIKKNSIGSVIEVAKSLYLPNTKR